MLSALTVENFLIIDRVVANFERGMTVLTGETGTGKSILIDALELTLGRRAQSHLLRPGANKLSLSIALDVSGQTAAISWLKKQSMENDENSCVIRRVINSEGRSQAYINGSLSTLEQLKELTMLLVDVAGQNNQQQLLDSSRHLALLDLYSDHEAQLLEMQNIYQQWKMVNDQLNHRQQQSQEIEIKQQWLTQQCQELEQAAIKAGEYEQIEQEHRVLSQKEKLKQALANAYQALDAESQQNANLLLATAYNELHSLSEIDTKLQEVAELVNYALDQSNEAAREIKQYLDRIDNTQGELETIERRLGVLTELARKYKTSANLLPEKLEQMSHELKMLDDPEQSIEQLEKKRDNAEADYKKIALQVSGTRKRSARVLEEAVLKLLKQLNMKQAQFKINFVTDSHTTPSPSGLERVAFMLCANPGQKLQPLAKAASGGELSRISLALQVALSNRRMIPVLIFDEVDSGVGGATAEIVGRLLKKLSSQTQVFCVTHLAQIACQADHHYYVEKVSKDGSTSVSLTKLNKQDRLQELARMIAGTKITKQSLDHARQMLATTE
ncbi:MAG: DNA repair protein RecN [Chromatiales bacterium]|nr:DNA repair protein RecN [Chromatiales bacterium]